MANTLPANEVFARDLMYEVNSDVFFSQFIGEPGSRSLVIRHDELNGNAGDTIKINVFKALQGAGVTGVTTLEGNEEDMTTSLFPLNINIYRHAVKFNKMENQANKYDTLLMAKNALKNWAIDKIEKLFFNTISNNNDIIIYGGDAATTDELDASDVMNTAVISRAKAKLKSSRKCAPIRINNKNYYVMFVDPFQAYSLKQDTVWINNRTDASTITDNNDKIVQGALGIWDDVIVYETNYLVTGTNANNIRYARAVILGAEAVGYGYAKEFSFIVQERDYGFITGVATDALMGIEAITFDNQQHAIVAIETAAIDPNA